MDSVVPPWATLGTEVLYEKDQEMLKLGKQSFCLQRMNQQQSHSEPRHLKMPVSASGASNGIFQVLLSVVNSPDSMYM